MPITFEHDQDGYYMVNTISTREKIDLTKIKFNFFYDNKREVWRVHIPTHSILVDLITALPGKQQNLLDLLQEAVNNYISAMTQ